MNQTDTASPRSPLDAQRAAEAIQAAIARHQDDLLGMLYYLVGNPDDAVDALQETFQRGCRQRDSMPIVGDLKSWIVPIAMAVGRERRSLAWRRRRRDLPDEDTLLDSQDLASIEPSEARSLARLRRALLQLRCEEQEVLLLRQSGGMSYDEIAAVVGVPIDTVRTRMRLALARLRRGPDTETQRRLLELVYGLLPDDEASQWQSRAGAEKDLAEAHAEAETQARHLAKAAQIRTSTIALKRPPPVTPPKAKPAPKANFKKSRAAVAARRAAAAAPWVRAAHWLVGLAATALILFSLGGYAYHSTQMADLSAGHLRLQVIGPACPSPEVDNFYAVITSAVDGDPLVTQVEFSLFEPDGRTLLMGHQEKTDETGYLLIGIPAGTPLASGSRLKIVATCEDKVEQIDCRLKESPVNYVAQLVTDQPEYQPGETIRCRVLALSRLGLASEPPVSVRLELRDPRGSVVPGSARETDTRHGLCEGQFRIPGDAPAGRYTLAADSPERLFVEQQLSLEVRDGRTPSHPSRPAAKTPSQPRGEFDVVFSPEGGELVADLENRVYFASRDASGRPASLAGRVVNDQGEELALVESNDRGLGMFVLEPRTGESCHLEITNPAGVKDRPKLPRTSAQANVVLTTGSSVFEVGEPLEFNVRATASGLPLVAAAYCRGVLVGYYQFESRKGPNEVAIELDERADGLLQLVVFDYRDHPPRAVARRWVYRRPTRYLQVRLQPPARKVRPGQNTELAVSVVDESGKPVRAGVGVTAIDESLQERAELARPQLPAHVFLTHELGALPDPGYYLSENPGAAVALDLLLGTSDCRGIAGQFVPSRLGDAAAERSLAESSPVPPAVFDNLLDLTERYRDRLKEYRTARTHTLSLLAILSFFGGAALLLLATLLSILGIAAGLRIWIPAVLATAGCLAYSTVLISPEMLHPVHEDAVPYTPFQVSPEAPSPAKEGSDASEARGPKSSSSASDASRDVSPSGDPYTSWGSGSANKDGHMTIPLHFPKPGTYQIRVDVWGSGRVGSAEIRSTIAP